MNTNILKKCVDELNKEKPDLAYLKGILETVIELNETNNVSYTPVVSQYNLVPVPETIPGPATNVPGSWVTDVGRVAPLSS